MASSPSANSVMERAEPDPLQCPRCNSCNTKFCYYNNYSLSQPRHFCKACKRYWTRGGTLRNVPIGGGYRKNKKFKRHPPPSAAAAVTASIKPSSLQPDASNPFYSMPPTNFPLELNFPFSATRVSSDSPRFDDPSPRTNGPRPEFSPYFRIGSDQNIQDRADFISFGSSNFAQHHHRFAGKASHEFPSLMPYEDTQMVVGNGQIGKESRMFQGEVVRSNQIEQMNSSILWNSNNVNGVWFDPSSSSVPSLI